MPDAPSAVVNAVSKAVTDSGGAITHTVKVNADVFDTTKAEALTESVNQFSNQLQLTDTMSTSTRFGLALGRALLAKEATERDGLALAITESLTSAGLITVAGKSTAQAGLVVVVTAQATDPRTPAELLKAHVEMDAALKAYGRGAVLAGPNSDNIEGTDVLTARTEDPAVESLSTVDVADLSSGVTTVILALKEQLLGRQGHYGALTKADAPMPQLPVR